ncbi:MAG: chemotaxis-specific protein-glutamate methyltransferase CheB [Acidobacteriota bacterium]
MINVLIVEDSTVALEFLLYVFNSDPEIHVVGVARNGEEAIEAVKRYKPNVVTMDINMPKMNGFEATRKIMETFPTPIIIVSNSWNASEVSTTFHALEAGALMVIPRPAGIGHQDHEKTAQELINAVKLMSEVKVVRRWPKTENKRPPALHLPQQRVETDIQIVVIGASTGGPIVLQTILSALAANFPAPILIVQHMASGFITGFADWLGATVSLTVRIAANGDTLQPGNIYIAPDGFQLRVGIGGRIILAKGTTENGHCPSVSHCFRSVAETYGKNALGILLSGMGRDGVEELKIMREYGVITIAQDRSSCVVFGMPGEAINIGAAQYVLNPEGIVELLQELVVEK